MAGVEAERQPLGLADAGERRAQLLGAGAERVAGAGGVLEGDPDPPARGAPGDLVERAPEPGEPRRGAGALVGARVEHDEGQAEPLGALELVDEGGHGARPIRPDRAWPG